MRVKKKVVEIKQVKCLKCGLMNHGAYKFCIKCGEKLGGEK